MLFHFIAGLPRSGSSLLAAILNQHPQFHAGFQSPVGHIVAHTQSAMSTENEAYQQITDEKRRDVLRGIFDNYYHLGADAVVFDNNRRWLTFVDLLANLYPGSKVLVTVRSPNAIVDSLERLFRSNPLRASAITKTNNNKTVYDRLNIYMAPDGVLGYAMNALRTAYYSAQRPRLVLINYDDLARFPGRVMEDVHDALGMDRFNYDFTKIQPLIGAENFDEQMGAPGLHSVKSRVVYEERKTILPPDVWQGLPKPFWTIPAVKKETTTAK